MLIAGKTPLLVLQRGTGEGLRNPVVSCRIYQSSRPFIGHRLDHELMTVSSQTALDVLQQQGEVQFVRWARLELGDEVAIKVAGLGGFTVDQKAATADVVADHRDALNDVAEQPPHPSPCLRGRDEPKPCEQRDGLRIPASAFAQPWRSIGDVDLSHGSGVVGHDLLAMGWGHDEDTGRPIAIDWRA